MTPSCCPRWPAATYPREELRRLWQTLLLNQFHDILPGTSITEVNVRARADLAGVVEGAEAISRGRAGRAASGRST